MATRRIWIPKATESLSMRQTELISWNDRRLLNCNEGWRIWRHESCIIVIIIIYYYVLLLLCIIRHFSWQKLRHSLHLSRPLRCPVICAVRGSCHPPYDHMRWSCTQFSLPWNVKWLYSILHTSIFFRALHTHTHGFIYIYKPDTNSNTVLPCARPKHIHITYHSFTILTHIYIYIFIYIPRSSCKQVKHMFTFSWTCSFDFSKLLRGKLLGASSQAGSAGPCHQSWYYIIIAVSVSMCVMSRYVSIFCMIWLNNSLASVRVVIGTCLWKVSSAKGAIWINADQFGAKCKMLLKHHQGLKGNAAHQHIRIPERNKKDGGQRAF